MRKRGSKTSLFLMELLLVILFFSAAAAICLQVFAAAHKRSQDSGDLNAAVLAAQSAAESWKAAGGDPVEAAALLGAPAEGGQILLYYDGDWSPCGPEAAYARLTLRWDGALADIAITRTDGSEVYALSARSLGGAVHE